MLIAACGVSNPPAAATTSAGTPGAASASAQARTQATQAVTLTWYGQSTFTLAVGSAFKALLDPTNSATGYQIPVIQGVDLVTVSHEHSDHNNVGLAAGSPQVLKGLAGSDWAKIDQQVKGVRVRTVGVYHDAQLGTQRGRDAIFIYELEGLRIAHLGDLGHPLTPEQLGQIGPLDVVMIPVGGYYTVDAKTAAEVVGQLNPRVVIPMHYKTPDLGGSLSSVLAPVDDFIKALGSRAAVNQAGQSLSLSKDSLPAALTVYVLKYK